MIFAKKRVAAADEVSESKAGNTLYPNDQMQKILNYVAVNQEIDEKTVIQGRGKTKTYILGGRSL